MGAEFKLAKVGEVKTASEARILIDESKRTEQLLRAIDKLHENLVKLVDHEIEVYKAIRDAGLASKVKGVAAQYACEEFAKLTDRGIYLLRGECIAEGMTVRANLERQRIHERNDRKVESFCKEADKTIVEFKESGIVDISRMDSKSWDRDTAYLLDAAKNRLKDRLLVAGAVGIGDGVYIDPGRNKDKVWASLIIRLKSIRSDIESAARLYAALPIELSAEQRGYLDSIGFSGFCEYADGVMRCSPLNS